MASEWYIDSDHILHGPPGMVEYRPIPEAYTQEIINPWNVILHSNAGPRKTSPDDLWKYVNRPDITLEPHIIGPDEFGRVIQPVPFNRRADCNAKANAWWVPYGSSKVRLGAISFETQDNGSATLEDTPWNVAQVDTMANVLAAIGRKYGIPYEACATWDDQGIDYHSKFQEWSIYVGKTCPGKMRIKQMDWIRHRAAEIAASVCDC